MINDFVGSNGKYLTKALFLETNVDDKFNPPYTLSNRDKGEVPSLKRLYLEMEDMEEYTFATKHLQDWQHWEALCNSPQFKDIIKQWRFELSKKLNSRALLQIKDMANNKDDKNFVQANRILLGRTEELKASNVEEHTEKATKGVGRPPKSSEGDYLKESIEDDYKRMQTLMGK